MLGTAVLCILYLVYIALLCILYLVYIALLCVVYNIAFFFSPSTGAVWCFAKNIQYGWFERAVYRCRPKQEKLSDMEEKLLEMPRIQRGHIRTDCPMQRKAFLHPQASNSASSSTEAAVFVEMLVMPRCSCVSCADGTFCRAVPNQKLVSFNIGTWNDLWNWHFSSKPVFFLPSCVLEVCYAVCISAGQ